MTLFVGALGCSSKETEPASSEADSYRDANFAKSLGTLTVTLCVGASCCSSKETKDNVGAGDSICAGLVLQLEGNGADNRANPIKRIFR